MKPEELQAIREEIAAIKKDGVIMKWSMDWDSTCTDREKAIGDKYMGTVKNLAGKLDDALNEIELLRNVLKSVQEVMNESVGVVGWHLNGEVATWSELGLDDEVAGALEGDK